MCKLLYVSIHVDVRSVIAIQTFGLHVGMGLLILSRAKLPSDSRNVCKKTFTAFGSALYFSENEDWILGFHEEFFLLSYTTVT